MAGSIRLSLNEVYKMYTTQNMMATSFCRRNFVASLSKCILFDEVSIKQPLFVMKRAYCCGPRVLKQIKKRQDSEIIRTIFTSYKFHFGKFTGKKPGIENFDVFVSNNCNKISEFNVHYDVVRGIDFVYEKDETCERLSQERWMCSNQQFDHTCSFLYCTHLNTKSSNCDKFCANHSGPNIDNASDESILDSRRYRQNKPTLEEQIKVYNTLRDNLPKFFIQSQDYSIYHSDIVFENNILGIKTRGLTSYMMEAAKLRTVGHFKFAYVKFDVLHMNLDETEKCVKIRWRITGISAFKVMTMLWKYKPWEMKKVLMEGDKWYDGFSIFYIGEDGKIFKHIADKLMPDDEKSVEKVEKEKEGIPALKT